MLVTQLARLRAQRAPAAPGPAARQGWLRRWSGFYLERGFANCCHAARSSRRRLPGAQLPPLEDALHDAVPRTPSLHGDPDFSIDIGVFWSTSMSPSSSAGSSLMPP